MTKAVHNAQLIHIHVGTVYTVCEYCVRHFIDQSINHINQCQQTQLICHHYYDHTPRHFHGSTASHQVHKLTDVAGRQSPMPEIPLGLPGLT